MNMPQKDTIILFKGIPYRDDNNRAGLRVPLIPLSLICLASPVLADGYKVKIIDSPKSVIDAFDSIKGLLDRVICVGISALTGHEIEDGLAFSRLIKESSRGIPVVWGGWHVSILAEESISNSYVDIIVEGLGHVRFAHLVRCLASGHDVSSIKGIYYKDGERSIYTGKNTDDSLASVPLPVFEMLDIEYYRKHSLLLRQKPVINGIDITGYLYYVTSFGCPNECAYCCSRSMFERRLYSYNIDKVVEQVKWLAEEKGFNAIGFMDANFFIDIKRVEYFCELLLKKNVKFFWDAQMHVMDILRYEKNGILGLLRKSGCVKVNIGAESGSPEILSYIKKNIGIDNILRSARILTGHNIEAAYNFLFGLPAVEGWKQIYESFDLAVELKKINANFSFPVSFYVPFPGTEMYRDAVKRGLYAPAGLEEWGSVNTEYTIASKHFPWKSKRRENLIYDAMTFYIPLAYPGDLYRGTLTQLKEKIEKSKMRLFIRIGNILALLRVRRAFYRLPIEMIVFKVYRLLKGAGQYMPGGKCDVSKISAQ